jgi:hypothetical protein
VVPGVCLIQAVVVMVEDFYKTNVFIKEIGVAKFFMPLVARQEIIVTCALDSVDGVEFLGHVKINCDEKKIAQLELKLQLGEM